LFGNGMVGMSIMGLWRVPIYYEFLGDRVGIAHLPMREREAAAVHNLAYVSYANTPYADAVRLFMEFATTQEHGDFVAPVFLPAHSGSQHIWFERFPDLNLQVFGDAMEYAFPQLIAGRNAGPAATALEQELERAFVSGEGITMEMLEQINAAVNEVVNQ